MNDSNIPAVFAEIFQAFGLAPTETNKDKEIWKERNS